MLRNSVTIAFPSLFQSELVKNIEETFSYENKIDSNNPRQQSRKTLKVCSSS